MEEYKTKISLDTKGFDKQMNHIKAAFIELEDLMSNVKMNVIIETKSKKKWYQIWK